MVKDEKIGRMLVREGVITEEQLNQALEVAAESYGKPLGEVMMEMKVIDEADFLRVLAKKFHTQYLTTKKLSELSVAEAILKLVPLATAEKYFVFPVQYKKAQKIMTVVMANPDDVGAVDEIKFVSGIGVVKSLVGRHDSIKAAIDKWYKDDERAFDALLGLDAGGYELGGSAPPGGGLETEDAQLDLSALVSSSEEPAADKTGAMASVEIEDGESPFLTEKKKAAFELGTGDDHDAVFLGGMTEMPGDNNLTREQVVIEDLTGDAPMDVEEVMVSPMSGPHPAPEADAQPESKPAWRDAKKFRLRMLVVEPHDSIRKFIIKLFTHEGFRIRGSATREDALEVLKEGDYDSLVIKDKDLGEGEEFANLMAEKFPEVELCSIKDYGSALIGETRAQKRLMSSFLETLDILLGMLEIESGGMQGHGHNAAKYAKLIASKLDLPQREVDAIALASYVHDLGKKGMKHLSLLQADDFSDKDELLEQAEIPLRLLSAAKYPLEIGPIIRHMFEKWDGTGAPDKLKGEDIPAGARILALVEAFEHLTNRHGSEEAVKPTAALEIFKKFSGSHFDPTLVDLLLGIVRDDIYLQQMASAQDRILIVDTEVDQATLLELRLVNLGFAASAVRSAGEAINKARDLKPSLIITETELPDLSGFEMIEKLKEDPDTRDIPFVFLSRNDDSKAITRGFQLGAEDYMIKPMKIDILGAKITPMMNRLKAEKKTAPAAAGVAGNLSEMSLPDIVQILGAGRKTGRITMEDDGKSCYIEMEDGQVANAAIDDLKGEEAFYKILYWEKGAFRIDPTAKVSERLINMSIDALMLEGFRRMDESGQGQSPEDIALDGSDLF